MLGAETPALSQISDEARKSVDIQENFATPNEYYVFFLASMLLSWYCIRPISLHNSDARCNLDQQ